MKHKTPLRQLLPVAAPLAPLAPVLGGEGSKIAAALLLLFLTAGAANAGKSDPPDVGFDQRLNEQLPLDLTFHDESGATVRVGDYFGDRPVILVPAYLRCPRLCNLVLNELTDALNNLTFNAGNQFQVVVVSFDARETPELAAAKKASYLERYNRPGAEAGWHFLTGDEANIEALTRAIGFRYRYDAEHDQFAHASGFVVLTPSGKMARYFFGMQFPPRHVRLALVEAGAGKVGNVVDQILLLCYHYDPATGRYTATVMNLVRLAGILTVLILGTFLVRAWRREWRNGRQQLATAR
jgi:protein SCO1/2